MNTQYSQQIIKSFEGGGGGRIQGGGSRGTEDGDFRILKGGFGGGRQRKPCIGLCYLRQKNNLF